MQRLKELRSEMGLTQKELAEKIGSTSKSIWAYENKIAVPPLDVLIKLADVFQCTLDYLSSRSDDFGNITIVSSGQQKNAGLKPDEKELLETFRKLDMKNKMHVISYATVRLEGQQERRTI